LAVRGNQGSRQNFPDEYRDKLNVVERPSALANQKVEGNVTYYESQIEGDIDYEQPREFYQVQMNAQDRANLHSNIAGTLVNVDNDDIRETLLEQFGKVDSALERGVREAYKEAMNKASA
jgi:catalase